MTALGKFFQQQQKTIESEIAHDQKCILEGKSCSRRFSPSSHFDFVSSNVGAKTSRSDFP